MKPTIAFYHLDFQPVGRKLNIARAGIIVQILARKTFIPGVSLLPSFLTSWFLSPPEEIVLTTKEERGKENGGEDSSYFLVFLFRG
jgi:hypothetical protein